jgi:hypothetical protein
VLEGRGARQEVGQKGLEEEAYRRFGKAEVPEALLDLSLPSLGTHPAPLPTIPLARVFLKPTLRCDTRAPLQGRPTLHHRLSPQANT